MEALNMRKALAALVALGAFSAISVNLRAQTKSSPPPADNAKVNQRDRPTTALTADQGKNNLSDRDLMQKIRKSIMDDKSLSTYGHNVKVIAQNGMVTLKGPVRSDEEKDKIERMATDVAGAGNVTNQITVKPPKKS